MKETSSQCCECKVTGKCLVHHTVYSTVANYSLQADGQVEFNGANGYIPLCMILLTKTNNKKQANV